LPTRRSSDLGLSNSMQETAPKPARTLADLLLQRNKRHVINKLQKAIIKEANSLCGFHAMRGWCPGELRRSEAQLNCCCYNARRFPIPTRLITGAQPCRTTN